MDTLTIAKELLATGLKQEQAEAIAYNITKAVAEKNKELATKGDLFSVRSELKTNISYLKWMIGFLALSGAGAFGYLLNAINNNHDLLNTIISKLG